MAIDFIYVRGHLLAEQFIVHIEPGMQESPYLDPDHFQGPEALMYRSGSDTSLAFLVTDIFGRQLVVCKGEGGPAYGYIEQLQRRTFARMMNGDNAPIEQRRSAPIRPVQLVPPAPQTRPLVDEKTHSMPVQNVHYIGSIKGD